MLCHGELARSRPSPRHLTAFYLTIAAGGALGGVFAAIFAPRVFSEFSEYPIGLAGACILGFLCWMRSGALAQWTGRNFAVRVPLMALMFGGIISVYAAATNKQPGVEARRNFYGVLRVVERSDENGPLRELSHGRVHISRTVTAAAPRSANSRIATLRMTAAAVRSSSAVRILNMLNICLAPVKERAVGPARPGPILLPGGTARRVRADGPASAG